MKSFLQGRRWTFFQRWLRSHPDRHTYEADFLGDISETRRKLLQQIHDKLISKSLVVPQVVKDEYREASSFGTTRRRSPD